MDDLTRLDQHTYVRHTATRVWDNLPSLLLAAALFSLLCAPALLLFLSGAGGVALLGGALIVAPAWTALLAQELDFVRDVKVSAFRLLKALPRYWARSAKLGLMGTFPLFAALFTLPSLARPQVPSIVWIGLAADILGVLVFIALSFYAFPLMVLLDMNVRLALRNALILASRHIANTLGLLGMGIVFAFAIMYVSSGLLLILPAIWGMFIVNNCRLVLAMDLTKGS